MERTIRRLRTGVLSVAVAGALGFGAVQALASPRDVAQRVCSDRVCARLCTTLGFPGGFCAGDSCVCYLESDRAVGERGVDAITALDQPR